MSKLSLVALPEQGYVAIPATCLQYYGTGSTRDDGVCELGNCFFKWRFTLVFDITKIAEVGHVGFQAGTCSCSRPIPDQSCIAD